MSDANYSNDGANGSGAYQSGTWTSPDYGTSFGFNELIASWNATTPNGTWIQVEVQPKLLDGHWAKSYILGRWSSSDSDFHRTSVGVRETLTVSSRSTPGSPRTTWRWRTG